MLSVCFINNNKIVALDTIEKSNTNNIAVMTNSEIEPYFSESNKFSITVENLKINIKYDGDDLLWPNADRVKFTATASESFTIKVDVRFEYHKGGSATDIIETSTGSITLTGTTNSGRFDAAPKVAKKWNVLRAYLTFTIIDDGKTLVELEALLRFHL